MSVFPTVSVGLIKDLTSAWPGHDLGAAGPGSIPPVRQCALPGPSPKDLPAQEPSPEHAHAHSRRLPSNSIPAAITQPLGCSGLLEGSVLADCREAEVSCGSAKHQGIRQDGCNLAGASLGAPGRRGQLVQCSILAGISPECRCQGVSCFP